MILVGETINQFWFLHKDGKNERSAHFFIITIGTNVELESNSKLQSTLLFIYKNGVFPFESSFRFL